MAGARPSRLLEAMLSRAVASRTENCCSPSRPGGIVGLPPFPGTPHVVLAPPSEAAAATPALAPMNWRRVSFPLIRRLLLLPLRAASWNRGRGDLVRRNTARSYAARARAHSRAQRANGSPNRSTL